MFKHFYVIRLLSGIHIVGTTIQKLLFLTWNIETKNTFNLTPAINNCKLEFLHTSWKHVKFNFLILNYSTLANKQ